MTLEQANRLINSCAEQMNARYGKVVFDEWAIVTLAENKGRLLAYNGPRKEGFQRNFRTDLQALQSGLISNGSEVGNYEFSRHGVGTSFESFMVLGHGVFLICNNTVQTMDNIARDPLWIGAQVPFVELSERVQADPVTVTA
jgi:hypothetical protein